MVMYIAIFKTVESKGRLRLISQHLVLTRSKVSEALPGCKLRFGWPHSTLDVARASAFQYGSAIPSQLHARSHQDVARREKSECGFDPRHIFTPSACA
jgi:hypothetical protein